MNPIQSPLANHALWRGCAYLLAASFLFGSPGQVAAQSVGQVLSYDRPDVYGILETKDILVPMRDGFRLTCDLYQPATADGRLAPGRFPGFVKDYTGYGRRDHLTGGSDFITQKLAAKGYNVIWCNTRGSQGRALTAPAPNSIALISPWSEQEQQDNYDLIEWLAAQPWSNGKVGQTGASYGGITTWLVAANQKPPSLKAIVPITASHDNYRHFAYPGGIRTSDLRGLWPSICSGLTGEPTCSARVTADWALHPNFDSYWQVSRADVGSISVPTLYFAGHQDLFQAGTDPLISLMGSKPNFSLFFGPWAHENTWSTPNATVPLGVLLAFFDRWLADLPGVPTFPKYSAYQSPLKDGVNRWRSFGSWPPANSMAVRYWLAADGTLQERGGAAGLTAYNAGQGQLTFDTPPVAEDLVVAGPIEVGLRAAFSSTDMNVFARVDQVDLAGNVIDMGYGAQLKMSHRTSDSTPTPIVPGLLYSVKFTIPSKFWTLEKGTKLRVTIKSVDATALEPVPPGGVVTLSTGPDTSYVKLNWWKP
jgi:predicted acyl esterase